MARKSQDLKRIEAAEADVETEIGALEARLAELRGRREKLQTAKSVLQELSGSSSVFDALIEELDGSDDEGDDADQPLDGVKDVPPGTTIGDLALVVLEHSGADGGMTSAEILNAIRATWLPDLARTSLSPPLSRLKKRGIIELDGEHWRLAAKNEVESDE